MKGVAQWRQELRHRNAVAKKKERVDGLTALLESWEPHEAKDDETKLYVRDIRRKLAAAKHQLEAMLA